MISKNSTILAVGATGKFAGLVLPELAKRGAFGNAIASLQYQQEQESL